MPGAKKTENKLINILIENSRLSYRQIAKKLGVSVATAMKKVKALEEKGIIRSYTVSLDYDALGYDIPVIVDIRVSKGKLFLVEKKIAAHPYVQNVYDNTGAFDATVIARFPNRRQMDAFLKKVQKYDFVERTETKLVLNTIKEENIRL